MYDNQIIAEKFQEGIKNGMKICKEELFDLFKWFINFSVQECWNDKLNEIAFFIGILLLLLLCFYLIVKIRNFVYDHILNC